MGVHGSPTCVLSFENAEGYLVGEPHDGLAAMFSMMNTEKDWCRVTRTGAVRDSIPERTCLCQR